MNSQILIYNIVFDDWTHDKINIKIAYNAKIGELINEYLRRIQKSNLIIKNFKDIDIVFVSNSTTLNHYTNEKVGSILSDFSVVRVIFGNDNNYNYKIIKPIKENNFTSVFIAQDELTKELVAIKKIYKDKLKEEMKFTLCKKEITEKDFEPEIVKFNKEIENMKKCQCENSVKIYDYYDTEKEFIIIMELCDETLFDLLCEKDKGFSSKEIKEILLQLNNVFKLMNKFNISHRDIKLNNILVKYLNREKNKYKVLLSDYGISNQLYSLTQKFTTHAGSQLIMAPEILNDDDYINKCDLWSLGIIIFQLYTKRFPYIGNVEKAILKQIKVIGQKVLDDIDFKDNDLKDLLSKLLVRNPEKRISWNEYFNHPFFKN